MREGPLTPLGNVVELIVEISFTVDPQLERFTESICRSYVFDTLRRSRLNDVTVSWSVFSLHWPEELVMDGGRWGYNE